MTNQYDTNRSRVQFTRLILSVFLFLTAVFLLKPVSVFAEQESVTTYTEGTLYYVVVDDTVTITGCFSDSATVYIPESIAGKTVTAFAKGAFTENAAIEKVVVEDDLVEYAEKLVEEGGYFGSWITVLGKTEYNDSMPKGPENPTTIPNPSLSQTEIDRVYGGIPEELYIITDPEDCHTAIGEQAAFNVEADGAVTYQWQYSKDGEKWYKSTASGADTDTLTFKVTASNSSNLYRCKMTGDDDQILYSETAGIVLNESVKIITQPVSVSADTGDKISFSVEAENVSTYQWQYSKDGTKWYNSTGSGAATDTLSLTFSSVNAGNQYRCKLTGTDGKVVYTDIVKAVKAVEIITQPESVSASIGDSVNFTLKAVNAVSYQWYYTTNGGAKWYRSTAEGSTTSTISLKASSINSGNEYRCTITGEDGTVIYSDIVKMNVVAALKITAQPESVSAAAGDQVSFSVTAENAASYQWYYSKDGGKTWFKSTASGAATDTMTIKASSSNMSSLYRCKITGEDGRTINSNSVGINQ